ncbi:hypothetical protein MBLNU457_6772t1 [Dothideomycetes sp. NU457]
MLPSKPLSWTLVLLTTLATAQNLTTGPLYNPLTATITSTHALLYTSQLTCTSIISSHLSQIASLNPTINALTTLSPTSLSRAAEIDALLSSPNFTPGPLTCIPILLKDSFDSPPLATTAGSLALANLYPSAPAPVVRALTDAGAIVLGKANMHEFALEGITVSSLGGQTRNPFALERSPGGSSGGTGAALAAGFAVLGTGSDTVNSLRSPASANGLVSVRATRGLISRSGVVGVSFTQDVVGPMARCVRDVAVMLGVMAGVGFDQGDNATALVPEGVRGSDYAKDLDGSRLEGLRIGVLEGFFDRTGREETDAVNEAVDSLIEKLKEAGVEIIRIEEEVYDANAILKKYDVQKYEFREAVEEYLQRPDLEGGFPKTLKEIYDRDDFVVIPPQYEHVKTALRSSTSNESYPSAMQDIADLKQTLHNTFSDNKVDAIIYPQQRNLVVKIGTPSQHGRNGILAAVTGSPVVAVPAGFSVANGEEDGVPIGMEILGRPWTEAKLLQIAYQIERFVQPRTPKIAQKVMPQDSLTEVPQITPNKEDIHTAYPRAVLNGT